MSSAYSYNITQNSKTKDGKFDSHQTNAGCVLTFLRWENRDPLRYPSIDARATRDPLVVENDCVQLTVQENKDGLTGSIQATLLSGDINYRTAVAPGDFLFVNILNWTESTDTKITTVKSVAARARSLRPINGFNDGFKGVFKVQNVRKGLRTNPDGTKQLVFFVNAFSFTEFNNKMYFNPFLLTAGDASNDLLFVSRISDQWQKIVSNKSEKNIQNILKLFITAFLGEGLSDEGRKVKGIVKSPNDLFFMPEDVGKLLGLPKVKKAADIYNYLMGIQEYATNGKATVAKGFNPIVPPANIKGRFYETKKQIEGISIVKPEYWNQKQVFSIIREYLNSVLNECYTTHRIDVNGRVMPTMVFRQKPFTTEHYNESNADKATRFFNLPRWKIDPSMITGDLNLGAEEAARINFVQIFGRSIVINSEGNISDQIAKGNYVFDQADIQRNGLKPYIATSNFDFPDNRDPKGTKAPEWTKLIADMLIGGHLKENGIVPCVGIQEPIPVGDNLELDGIVYHIESVTHTYVQSPEGYKTFRTNIQVSNGVDLRSNKTAPFYPEMVHTDIFTKKIEDAVRNQLLPGFSDTQNIPGESRREGEEVQETKQGPFYPLRIKGKKK